MESQQPTPQAPRISRWWWLILLAMLVWNLLSFWPKAQPEISIPYSTFLTQVRAGNVASVRITGDKITGTFVSRISWPEATASPQATAESEPTAVAPAEGTSTGETYTEFDTTFPQAVGDPGLMPLLASHGVVIEVATPPTPWFGILLSNGLPLLLLVAAMVWIGRRHLQYH